MKPEEFFQTFTFSFLGNGADVPQYVEPPVIPGHEFSGRVGHWFFWIYVLA